MRFETLNDDVIEHIASFFKDEGSHCDHASVSRLAFACVSKHVSRVKRIRKYKTLCKGDVLFRNLKVCVRHTMVVKDYQILKPISCSWIHFKSCQGDRWYHFQTETEANYALKLTPGHIFSGIRCCNGKGLKFK
jgi:hypothetical protein